MCGIRLSTRRCSRSAVVVVSALLVCGAAEASEEKFSQDLRRRVSALAQETVAELNQLAPLPNRSWQLKADQIDGVVASWHEMYAISERYARTVVRGTRKTLAFRVGELVDRAATAASGLGAGGAAMWYPSLVHHGQETARSNSNIAIQREVADGLHRDDTRPYTEQLIKHELAHAALEQTFPPEAGDRLIGDARRYAEASRQRRQDLAKRHLAFLLAFEGLAVAVQTTKPSQDGRSVSADVLDGIGLAYQEQAENPYSGTWRWHEKLRLLAARLISSDLRHADAIYVRGLKLLSDTPLTNRHRLLTDEEYVRQHAFPAVERLEVDYSARREIQRALDGTARRGKRLLRGIADHPWRSVFRRLLNRRK